MRGDLERRLRRLAISSAASDVIEIWIEQDDCTLCSHGGERITREAFDHLHPRGSRGVIVLEGDDARS
jgi:hypothetical protein